MPGKKRLTVDSPATYELRLQGGMDQRWSEYLGGAEIRVVSLPDQAPMTVVTGRFQDQAALAGALSLLYDLGLPLLSVEYLDDPQRRLIPTSAIAPASLAVQPPANWAPRCTALEAAEPMTSE